MNRPVSIHTTDEQDALVSALAKKLQEDATGQLLAEYCDAFDRLITAMQIRLREPLAPHAFLLNKTALDITEQAKAVIVRYWEQHHYRRP